MSRRRRSDRFFPLLAALAALAGACAPRVAPLREQAVRLYDQGSYDEARHILEELERDGDASGPLLYRLHYCLQATGGDGAGQTLTRAIEMLESEMSGATGLEVPFYLANAYQNSGRGDDARRVAADTTRDVEEERIAEPTEPVDMFRLAKLYADQGRREEATRWYEHAIASFGDDDHGGPYVLWASRFLAAPSFDRGDYPASARFYGALAEAGEASTADLDRLAVSLYRIGRYADAAHTWDRGSEMPSDDPDRSRYCARLAALGADAGTVPEAAPDGRPWRELSKPELEAIMTEQVRLAREALAEARGSELESPTADRLAQLRGTIRDAKAQFVGAAIEYAILGHGIREVAFFGGFARMIFQKQEWRVGGRRGRDAQPEDGR